MRSRNSLMRERREAFRDARLIVIASEGKDTERIYFKALAKERCFTSLSMTVGQVAQGFRTGPSAAFFVSLCFNPTLIL